MPGNKRPNRKPGKKRAPRPTIIENSQNNADNIKGGKHVTKTFGPKPSRSPISPGINRGSARGR